MLAQDGGYLVRKTSHTIYVMFYFQMIATTPKAKTQKVQNLLNTWTSVSDERFYLYTSYYAKNITVVYIIDNNRLLKER